MRIYASKICVFNRDEPFPAVIDNTEVIQTVKFLGPEIDGPGILGWLGDLMLALGTTLTQFNPLAFTIPPKPEDLWKAFRTEMETMFPDKKKRKEKIRLDLGDANTNEFKILLNGDTYNTFK